MSEENYVIKFSDTTQFTRPTPVLVFMGDGGKEIGRLDFTGPEMKFTGNAEASAKVFFDYVAMLFALRQRPDMPAGDEGIGK